MFNNVRRRYCRFRKMHDSVSKPITSNTDYHLINPLLGTRIYLRRCCVNSEPQIAGHSWRVSPRLSSWQGCQVAYGTPFSLALILVSLVTLLYFPRLTLDSIRRILQRQPLGSEVALMDASMGIPFTVIVTVGLQGGHWYRCRWGVMMFPECDRTRCLVFIYSSQ